MLSLYAHAHALEMLRNRGGGNRAEKPTALSRGHLHEDFLILKPLTRGLRLFALMLLSSFD